MEEINFIRPQEVFNRNTGESKVRYTSYDGSNKFVPVVEGENGVPRTLVVTTHAELKAMRDAGKLTPGALYRITDYQCTTTQANTRSAGHQFDIVVLALSEDTLSEEAWAMPHAGDTYFSAAKLHAWKLMYCLDNDKERFAWADDSVDEDVPESFIANGVKYYRDSSHDVALDKKAPYAYKSLPASYIYVPTIVTSETEEISINTYYNPPVLASPTQITSFTPAHEGTGLPNGHGVIYRMIDEFNNDIKYDFKNIQFKRKITDGQYDENGTETWCYTLNVWHENMCQDASIVGNTLPNDEGFVNGVYDNKFGCATAFNLYIEGVNTFAYALGDNVVLSFDDSGVYYGIYSNTIRNAFCNNTIGNEFYYNTIGNGFIGNTIGNGFICNNIGNDLSSNTIKNNFNNNMIGNSFTYNTIRNIFGNNMIGNNFSNKTISDNTNIKNYGNSGVELATKDDLNA